MNTQTASDIHIELPDFESFSRPAKRVEAAEALGDSAREKIQQQYIEAVEDPEFSAIRERWYSNREYYSEAESHYRTLRQYLEDSDALIHTEPGRPINEGEISVGLNEEIDFSWLDPCIGVLLENKSHGVACGAHILNGVSCGEALPDETAYESQFQELASYQVSQLTEAFPVQVDRISLLTDGECGGEETIHYSALIDILRKTYPGVEITAVKAGRREVLPEEPGTSPGQADRNGLLEVEAIENVLQKIAETSADLSSASFGQRDFNIDIFREEVATELIDIVLDDELNPDFRNWEIDLPDRIARGVFVESDGILIHAVYEAGVIEFNGDQKLFHHALSQIFSDIDHTGKEILPDLMIMRPAYNHYFTIAYHPDTPIASNAIRSATLEVLKENNMNPFHQTGAAEKTDYQGIECWQNASFEDLQALLPEIRQRSLEKYQKFSELGFYD